MKNKIINILIVIVSVAIIYLIGINVYEKKFKEEKKEPQPVIKHEQVLEEIQEEIPKVNYEEELNKIKTKYGNDDIVGILTLENTSFNEIVMQSEDNDYYLEHTVYHKSDWRGQTFLDYRVDINNSKKLIIYGHNAEYHSLPFEIFENYYDEDYIKEHRYLYLQTDECLKAYEIFSVHIEVKDWSYYNKMTFSTKEEYYNHIKMLKERSFYNTSVEIAEDDEILIIQTCATHKDYSEYENKFLLIIGKRVEKFDN